MKKMEFTIKKYPDIGEEYYHGVHSSGLPVYVIPKKHTTAFAVFATKYGSIDNVFRTGGEEQYKTIPDGVAHFLEHKLFEEENGEDAFLRYAKFGGNANAFTSFTRTAYLFSCTENFDDNLEILLDFVTSPHFTHDSVNKEQGIIGEEIRMYNDNPGWRVFFNLLDAMYINNPIKIDIAGTIESIAQITPETLYTCYNTFYNLHNMALCVSGDVTPEQVEAICDKVLKPAPEIVIDRYYPEEPTHINKDRVEINLEVSRPLYCIGIKDTPEQDSQKAFEKSAAIDIVLQMLFGNSGEFFNKHYSSGLINGTFSSSYSQSKNYAFVEIAGSDEDPDQIKQVVCEEIQKRRQTFFTGEDFDRAKRVVYASSLLSFNSTDRIANNFLSFAFEDGDFFDYPSIISAVDYDKAKELFLSVFNIDNIAMSVVSPNNRAQ